MSSYPNIRIARITTEVKYNKTNNASDIQWRWRNETRDVLQFQQEDGTWTPIPIISLFDDSERKAEQQQEMIDAAQIQKEETIALLQKNSQPGILLAPH